MQSVIIYVLNLKKQRFLIVLFINIIITQIIFQRLILSFDSIVNLRMKDNIKFFTTEI